MKAVFFNHMKVKSLITFLLLVHFLSNSMPIEAKVKLPSVLGSNMVLQQQADVKLWGKAKENSSVTVKTSWNNKTHKTIADKQGNWLLKVSTPTAGGPYEITFNDGEPLILKNILIGEVWFCSGQSNMEMPMNGFDRQPVQGTNNIVAKVKASTSIRIYNTDSEDGKWVRQFNKTPQEDCKGEWLENNPVNVSHTSATAYFFARYIQEVLEVPVGIIVSSLGGSKVEAWMSREAITPFKSIDLSTLDIGHPTFIHPTNKETVGNRLALWALAQTYGRQGFGYATPIYKSMEISDNKIYINVDNSQRGLCPMWTPLEGFEIAGEDKVFFPAYAEIETKTTRLTVSCEKVPHPVAVRYAYKNYTKASVFNVYGIPVAPFRTDSW